VTVCAKIELYELEGGSRKVRTLGIQWRRVRKLIREVRGEECKSGEKTRFRCTSRGYEG